MATTCGVANPCPDMEQAQRKCDGEIKRLMAPNPSLLIFGSPTTIQI
jgi:hypothetical protein